MSQALVTGGNKGIGLAAVKLLAQGGFDKVFLGARDASRGQDAVKELEKAGVGNVEVVQLDVTDDGSAEKAAAAVKAAGGLDVLVCNAGIAWRGDAFDEHVVRETCKVNFHGVARTLRHFLPLLKESGRCIVVSSQAGDIKKLSEELQAKFRDPQATEESLAALLEQFATDVKEGKFAERGWPKQGYAVSKIGATALVKVVARQLEGSTQSIYAMCPGYCRTDMTNPGAPRSAEQGADTALFLATEPKDKLQNGGFYSDRALKEGWF
eukprot:m.144097 g.144097  ORF g.144097 m.144097 type:complete len:267 (-) comp20450_c0_seq1:94-894(-)